MRKYENSVDELRVIKRFMREKKITERELSDEMKCSLPHLNSVFNGHYRLTPKLRTALLKSFRKLLEKDLVEFYELLSKKSDPQDPWDELIF